VPATDPAPRPGTALDRRLAHVMRPTGLARTLGPVHLTAIGLAAVIGSGIFVLSGQAAARFAGPAVVVSFLLSGVVALLAALCVAELATAIPVSGGAFSFNYTINGPFVGWMVAWAMVVEYLVGAGVMAIGWSGYAGDGLRELGIRIPPALRASPFAPEPGVVNLLAVLLILMVGALLARGSSESARVNVVLVGIKLLALVLFVAVGATAVHASNWDPFVPASEGFGDYGAAGVLRAAGVVFLTYIAFDAVATASQEARRPGRTLPAALVATLVGATALYVAVALVMTGLVFYGDLNVPDPLGVALDAHPDLLWLRQLVNVAAILGLAAGVLALLFGQSRIFVRLGREGMVPARLGAVDRRTGSPRLAVMVCVVAAALIAGFGEYDLLATMISAGTLFAYVAICVAVIRLRRMRPDLERPFRLPFGPAIPIAGIVAMVGVLLLLPPGTLARVGAWLVVGVVVWLAYSRAGARRARAARGEREGGATG
jgi:APA family basic amino acid/polyamine antiporter